MTNDAEYQVLLDKYNGHTTLGAFWLFCFACTGYLTFTISIVSRILCTLMFLAHGVSVFTYYDRARVALAKRNPSQKLRSFTKWAIRCGCIFSIIFAIACAVIPVFPYYIKGFIAGCNYIVFLRLQEIKIKPQKE